MSDPMTTGTATMLMRQRDEALEVVELLLAALERIAYDPDTSPRLHAKAVLRALDA